jgi:hypothetical protein
VSVQEKYPGGAHFMIVLRVDGSPELDERRRHYRSVALGVGIPVYDELVDAAQALRAVRWVEARWSHIHPAPAKPNEMAAAAQEG